MSDPYVAYVFAAYAIALGTVAALVAYAVLDRRAARRALGRAERAAARASGRR